ncbi:MAG: 3'-5' exonuclease [Myxococcales bacterium]|nr:3'-5' exonuclease [Myxococcales bacterium]
MTWLWRTYAPQRLLNYSFLPFPLTFVDIETTRDRIVEVATVRFTRNQVPSVFHTYVNPGASGWRRSTDYWNTEIHGLTPQQLMGRPTLQQLLPLLHQQLGDATAVGHNVAFERRFLHQEISALGGAFVRPELCTLKLARRLYPERKAEGSSHKLDDLAASFDIRNPAPHRAIGDTFTTIWVMLAMLERNADNPQLAAHVAESQRAPDGRRRNPWVG